jgi:hypothetical protein
MKVEIKVEELSPIYTLYDPGEADSIMNTMEVPETLYREYLSNRLEFWIIQQRLSHLKP